MLWGMLWIFGVYGAAIVMLHLVFSAHKRRHRSSAKTTFVLITHNNDTQIEWYLRPLIFVSKLRGRQIGILLFDEGSTDSTLAICRRIAAERSQSDIQIMEESLEAYLAAHPLTIQDAVHKDRRPRTEWKYDDLATAISDMKHGRSYAQGKEMFKVANCLACHKLEEVGQVYGPDLTQFDKNWSTLEI